LVKSLQKLLLLGLLNHELLVEVVNASFSESLLLSKMGV